uniref:Thioredoxin domain-containing protein n=1 Tax=Peronospora matthiolae TaxID=2874970 RepID=A0AAV1TQ41_9STRA
MTQQDPTTTSAPEAVALPAWLRFLTPYYVCNGVTLLMYVPIRYQRSGDALSERDNFFQIPLEYEIFLLALGSWLLNFRKKATADGVLSLFFLYGKLAVLASLYYLDITLFAWYAVICLVLFAAVGQPRYQGPSKISELDPAMMEKVVKRSSGARKKGPPNSWLVFFYADWSDSCVEHEPMLADLSLRYSSDSLQFGKIDVNKWSDLGVENRISVSTSSWQLPTLILFQNGEEVMRLPQIDDKGKVIKTVLDRAGLVAAFKLQELKEGKAATFEAKKTS